MGQISTALLETQILTLTKEEWHVPESMPFGNDIVVPIRAGEKISWKVS